MCYSWWRTIICRRLAYSRVYVIVVRHICCTICMFGRLILIMLLMCTVISLLLGFIIIYPNQISGYSTQITATVSLCLPSSLWNKCVRQSSWIEDIDLCITNLLQSSCILSDLLWILCTRLHYLRRFLYLGYGVQNRERHENDQALPSAVTSSKEKPDTHSHRHTGLCVMLLLSCSHFQFHFYGR